MKSIAQVSLNGTWVDVMESRYTCNNRLALIAYEVATGEKFAEITINVPEISLDEDEFVIPNEQMTEGMFQALKSIPLWEPSYRTAVGDHYCGPVMKLRRFGFKTTCAPSRKD